MEGRRERGEEDEVEAVGVPSSFETSLTDLVEGRTEGGVLEQEVPPMAVSESLKAITDKCVSDGVSMHPSSVGLMNCIPSSKPKGSSVILLLLLLLPLLVVQLPMLMDSWVANAAADER